MPRGVYIHKKLTDEHKRKIGLSLLGHITTEKTKRKIGLANSISKKGCIPWNKGTTTDPHKWIISKRGKAIDYTCEICGTKQARQWSNKNHKYNFIEIEWQTVCYNCHKEWDYKYNGTNNGLLGRNQSEKHRKNISSSITKWWKNKKLQENNL